ncbi:uncharacterized protein LOC132757985 [Ruditapes philippinarum]|uniref:uncharacterized protein LOC132757985 n=1 Tax=Ruditapes philippinarum TaxID=129788 RepID=UPI00295C36A5|nr:uncharacterized protein LOC132757985 [Ruditapes philippinarum]
MALPSTKRRRLILKQERSINQGAHEALEGATYESGIGHTADPDIQTLPDAVSKGKFKPVKTENPTFITFDLETTDLIRGSQMPHITQIAAKEIKTAASFYQNIIPPMTIAVEPQRKTGIKVTDDGYIEHSEHDNNLNVHESLHHKINKYKG